MSQQLTRGEDRIAQLLVFFTVVKLGESIMEIGEPGSVGSLFTENMVANCGAGAGGEEIRMVLVRSAES